MSSPAESATAAAAADSSSSSVARIVGGKKEVLNEGSIQRKHNRILVTGGAGFIGSHIIDRLMQDEKNIVICVDNCFSGSKANIQHHLNNPRFEFIRHGMQKHKHTKHNQNTTSQSRTTPYN